MRSLSLQENVTHPKDKYSYDYKTEFGKNRILQLNNIFLKSNKIVVNIESNDFDINLLII